MPFLYMLGTCLLRTLFPSGRFVNAEFAPTRVTWLKEVCSKSEVQHDQGAGCMGKVVYQRSTEKAQGNGLLLSLRQCSAGLLLQVQLLSRGQGPLGYKGPGGSPNRKWMRLDIGDLCDDGGSAVSTPIKLPGCRCQAGYMEPSANLKNSRRGVGSGAARVDL